MTSRSTATSQTRAATDRSRPAALALPFAPHAAPLVGALERRILDVLWRTKRAHTARSVMDLLNEASQPPSAYTTVATVLGHLVEKDLATREMVGNTWSYSATVTGCEFSAAHMVRSLAETNERRRCLTSFADMLDEQDRTFLKSLL